MRLAMVQMRVEPGALEQNLARAERLVEEAAQRGAEVIVLPEAMNLGWTHPSAASQAELIPEGASCDRLSKCARQHGIYVCAGLVEKAESETFNAAVLIGPDGSLLLHHRKINELDIARSLYATGGRLGVAQTEHGMLGLMICSDAFAAGQVISRTLGMMGAQVILSPCAWAVAADHDNDQEPYGQLWRDNYAPVAREFGLWIAGVSNVGWLTLGPWAGRKCIGCSLLVGPDGKDIVVGKYGVDAEEILYANIPSSKR
jgi:predicted amidohydrolase